MSRVGRSAVDRVAGLEREAMQLAEMAVLKFADLSVAEKEKRIRAAEKIVGITSNRAAPATSSQRRSIRPSSAPSRIHA